uniref:Uncharacterized protein n=1 Tax=Rhizophora mucronata TaxID=61149 RepID=A0A2P2MYW3_RHIMU
MDMHRKYSIHFPLQCNCDEFFPFLVGVGTDEADLILHGSKTKKTFRWFK